MSTRSIPNGPTSALQPCALQWPLGEGAHRRQAEGSPKYNSFIVELRKSAAGELFDLDTSWGRAEGASDVPGVLPCFVNVNVPGVVATLMEDRGGSVEEALAATSVDQPLGLPSEARVAAKTRHAGKAACAPEPDPGSQAIRLDNVCVPTSPTPVSRAIVSCAPEGISIEVGDASVTLDGKRPEGLAQRSSKAEVREPKPTSDEVHALASMVDSEPQAGGERGAALAGENRLLQASGRRPGAGRDAPYASEHHSASFVGPGVSPHGFSPGGFLDARCVDARQQDDQGAPAVQTSSTVEIAKQTSPRQISLVLRSETSAEIGVELRIASGKAHVGIVASADDARMIRADQTQLENKILTSTGLSAEVTVSVHSDQSAASMMTGDDGKFGFEPRASTRDEEAGRGQTPRGTIDQDRGEGRRQDRREADRARASDRRLLL